MMHMRSALPDAQGPVAFDGERDCWMAAQVPEDVRRRAEIVFDVLCHVPLQQPVAVVTADGRTAAVNVALVELLHGAPEDYIDHDWAAVMPAWPRRESLYLPGSKVFEEHLVRSRGGPVWGRVSVGAIARHAGGEPLGYVLFVSTPDLDKVDQDEVRRLRKGVDLLAGVPTDYVVEIDRSGAMSFVSPSFCVAVGARESELVGRPFLSRVCADDRAAAAEALSQARRAPFSGEMHARLAADRDAEVVWQMEAVIGEGVTGLDLVGHVERRGS
jgi:PAS domain-containing protein